MRKSGTTILSLFAGLAVCLSARAVNSGASSERYRGIPERNVFGLRPPQAQPAPAAQNSTPPQLILTGITTVLSNKLALLKAVLPASPGKPASEKPLLLAEGQREEGIEVLHIDTQARSVKVNDSGTVMTLTFEKNGVKEPSPSPPAGAYSAQVRPWPGRAMRLLPTRTPRAPASGGGYGAELGGNLAAPAESGQAQVAPPPAATPAPTNSAPPLTPAEEKFLQQLEQEASQTNATPEPTPPPPLPGQPLQLPQGANTQRSHPPLMPQ